MYQLQPHTQHEHTLVVFTQSNQYHHAQVPSERELPLHRRLQLANKRAARGAVSKYAPGTYAQTFGVIKQSDLHALQHT